MLARLSLIEYLPLIYKMQYNLLFSQALSMLYWLLIHQPWLELGDCRTM